MKSPICLKCGKRHWSTEPCKTENDAAAADSTIAPSPAGPTAKPQSSRPASAEPMPRDGSAVPEPDATNNSGPPSASVTGVATMNPEQTTVAARLTDYQEKRRNYMREYMREYRQGKRRSGKQQGTTQ